MEISDFDLDVTRYPLKFNRSNLCFIEKPIFIPNLIKINLAI